VILKIDGALEDLGEWQSTRRAGQDSKTPPTSPKRPNPASHMALYNASYSNDDRF
jgi:hypothetical protein